MFKIKQITTAALMIVSAFTANAGCLWIIGDATPSGWNMVDVTALLSKDGSSVYTGTIYLQADKEFKFLTEPDWGNLEYGAAPDAVMHDGTIALAGGKDDNGYSKLKVNENANYLITVDTDAMTATITKSVYQESEITWCSLFLVGGATPNGWSVMDGTPLYQNNDTPYIYSSKISLTTGDFKIATALVGASHWDPAYWYFRDADNSNKIVLNQDGDLKWDITEAGDYDVTVNVLDNSISITKSGNPSGINDIVSNEDADAEYYTVTGIRTETPANGIFICKKGNRVSKVIIK